MKHNENNVLRSDLLEYEQSCLFLHFYCVACFFFYYFILFGFILQLCEWVLVFLYNSLQIDF